MSDAYHNGRAKGGQGKTGGHRVPDTARQIAVQGPIVRRQAGRFGLAASLCLLPILLGSCGNTRSVASDATQIEGFRAGVVADEPRAALIGRTMISNGGNAADAVVAAYFAMSVTLPSAAGLGGGGICIAHNADETTTDIIDFLPRAAAAGTVAVPGNVRGMAALNARYGKLQFAALVGPAESLATTGTPISKALARDLQQYGELLTEDPTLQATFTRLDGTQLGEGDNMRPVDLAASLGQIRAQGVNAFYSGLLGQKLVEGAQAIGAPLTIDDLRNYKVAIYPPLETEFTDLSLYVAPPPASGGVITAQAAAMLSGADNSPAGQAAVSRQIMSARSAWMQPDGSAQGAPAELLSPDKVKALAAQSSIALPQENTSAASIVAIDSDGIAVACTFTMNAPFGAARAALGTGIVLAPAPNDQGVGYSTLSPVMLASKYNGEVYFLGGAGGGAPGALAEGLVLDGVMRRAMPLDQAMQLSRAYDDGTQQIDESAGVHIGRLNAIFCARGAPSDPDSCQLRNDYRGNGLAAILGEE
ncbi:gamma-glutamyltransferase [Dongia sp.]|uniref:gamma-glutamyltransferase n=1 Tax=Dongia sp. TaxID=1977262 RepID=UPI0035B07C5A